ncbi:MAG: hypothetical protein AAGB22_10010 [Bacteroidota bacterium]
MILGNYYDHPDQPKYMVYRFYGEEQAAYFEALLRDEGIWYERNIETDEDDEPTYYYGVHKSDEKATQRLNSLTLAKFKTPFIGVAWLRWTILLVSLGLVTLAIAGYLLDR